jgi:centromere protein J
LFEESSPREAPPTLTRRLKAPAPQIETVESIINGKSRAVTAPQATESNISEDLQEEMRVKLKELDNQIEKFKKENEYCKKLRLEREAALSDAQRCRERALKELEAAEKDIDEQRSQIVAERKRLQQDRDRGRSMVSQLRELQEENKGLKDQIEAMNEDFNTKSKRLKNEIVRLNGLVATLDKSKTELEVEVRSLVPKSVIKSVLPPPSREDVVVSSNSHPDGRIDRTFADGRREAVFPSGLRKSVWNDGSALVNVPNGDVKETSATGIVTYRYAATGCVQRTHPDGLEVLEFASGQVETHFPNGNKEILFPNKMVKRIDANGREQIISHTK